MNSQNDNNTYQNDTENTSYDFVSVQDTKENEKINREGKNAFVWFCLLFAILSFLLFTPVFNVKNIVVKESNFITVEQIIEVSQIVQGRNILSVNTQKAKERIEKIPLAKEVSIERKFPSTIEITVKECEKRAYITFMNKYLCIDKEGKIVEVLNEPSDTNLMIINNSGPKETFLGYNVIFKEKDKLDILKEFFKTLDDNPDMPNKIASMDLKNKKEIYITLDNDITVKLGDNSNLSYKIAYLKQILLTQLKTYRGGTLDLSDPENAVRYKGSTE